jgi:hypothetical protein
MSEINATQAAAIAAGGGGGGWAAKYAARGITKSTIPTGNADVVTLDFGVDFNVAEWRLTGTNTGPDTATGGGTWAQTSLGAVAGSMIKTIDGLAGTILPPIVPPGNTSKWYMAARFKSTPTTGAGITGIIGAAPTTALAQGINVGLNNAAGNGAFKGSTTDGTPVTVASTIINDGNYHIHELWSNGDGKLYYSVDDETPVSVSDTHFPTVACGPIVYQDRGDGTSGDHTFTADWQLFVVPQAA